MVVLFCYQVVCEAEAKQKKDNKDLLVVMRLGETPVLIPNTMVKT